MCSAFSRTGLVAILVAGLPLGVSAQGTPAHGHLLLPSQRSVRVALDRRTILRRVGQPITGTIVDAIYAYDRMVLPAGTPVSGHLAGRVRSGKSRRALAMIGGDFSPHDRVTLQFDALHPSDGPAIAVQTTVTGGMERVRRQVAPEPSGDAAPSAARRLRDQIAGRAHEAFGAIREPGRWERLKDAALMRLPYHPQFFRAGTVFTATLLSPVDFGDFALTPLAAAGSVPAPDSVLTGRLLTGVDSAHSPRGTPITAVITEPVFSSNHQLLLPEGTTLAGEVTYAVPARRMRRNGKLRLLFATVRRPAERDQPLLASLYALQSGAAEHLALDEEGGASVTNPKTRFLGPAIGVLALTGAIRQHTEAPDEPGDVGPEIHGNPGAQVSGGFLGFGLIGAVAGRLSRPASIAFGAIGMARTVYGSFFAKGREVSFPVDMPIQVRLAPAPARAK
jgi:hypothetical protein